MSRARCDFGEADRENIVKTSIRNNAAADVTGLLLSDGARFVQAIEGDDNEIDECFDRIRSDHRHYDLVVFDNGRIDKREFGKWSLNSRHQPDLDIMQFRSAVANDVRDVSDVRLKAMFIGFASLAR